MAVACSYLPEDLWERIFKFLLNDENNFYDIHANGMLTYNLSAVSLRECFESLSVVSKQFLSITNRLRFLVKISDQTIPLLHNLFQRFPNVTSLNIKLSSQESDLDELLTQISTFPLDVKSLTLYHPITVPANGLRAFSKKMKNLTSLTCFKFSSKMDRNNLFFIADCFPLLEELFLMDTDYLRFFRLLDEVEEEEDDQLLKLLKLRKITLSRNFLGSQSINDLCKNCDLLPELKVIDYPIPPHLQSVRLLPCELLEDYDDTP